MIVPDTPDGAAAWIRSRWNAFLSIEPGIADLMHRAAVARAESDDPETRDQALRSIERLRQLSLMHGWVVDRVRGIAGLIPAPGMAGLFAWPAVVVAVAVSIAWIWTRYDAEYQVVELLERGRLTAAEARTILDEIEGGPLIATGQAVLPWVALGLGAWWFVGRRRA